MQWSDLPRNPSIRTLRQFGVLCVLVFGSLAGWWWFGTGVSPRVYIFGGVAAVAGVFALFAPLALRPIFVGWMVVAFPAGWLVSKVALLLLFGVFITPFALFFRLVGRDLLILRRRPNQSTYWQAKPSTTDVSSYFRQS